MHFSRRTWRIRGVPQDFDKERLSCALRHHSDLQWPGEDILENIDNGVKDVNVHTLSRDLRADDKVATVRFGNLPLQLCTIAARCQLTIKIHVDPGNRPVGSNWEDVSTRTVEVSIDEHFDGITVLNSPVTDEKHLVDVLAVSGLGSHPFGSFVHKENGNMWLTSNLPRDMPNARVMIFGYESGLQDSNSLVQLDDLANPIQIATSQLLQSDNQKPLLLIGHSLGGLLVKQALFRISESGLESDHPDLLDSILGVLLFGTPNDGLDIESLIPIVNDQPNRSLLESLSPINSQVLRQQRHNFSVVLKRTNFELFCFYETEQSPTAAKDPTSGRYKMNGPRRFLVSQPSATSCLPADIASAHSVAIHRTHSDLIKFSHHDAEYDKVAYVLKRIYKRQAAAVDKEMRLKQSLIGQLYFSKIDERITHLPSAQDKTCRWFLAGPQYKSWKDATRQPDHGGFLWIKGNPGTGKSTLMKYLFEEAKLEAKGDPSLITLSFFFLARGTDEEKTPTGLYRSLLHQLFEIASDFRDSLEWMTADGARTIQSRGWSEEALQQTLKHAVPKLGKRSLTVFVDALDECDDDETADMVSFFEEICDCAAEAKVQVKICLSSRHYPTVSVKKGMEVSLEDEIGHTEDIRSYIKSRLRLPKSKQAEPLQSEILEKSSGIFLWVVLVVNILNKDKSISIKKKRERLWEIPPGLHDLFEMILSRDGDDVEQLQLCLKWILFATRPLKPQELYFAMQFGSDEECSGFWDQVDVDLDDMKAFVRNSSKGLAEVTRSKASEVQFIHESVRDFLLGKYEGQWSEASGNFKGHGHEVLKDCCLAQLNASISQNVDIPDPPPPADTRKAAELRHTISLKFPFLEYSVLNVLHHANDAQTCGMEQGHFLAEFPLQRWIHLNNALQPYDNRSLRNYAQKYTKLSSLLYIIAEENHAELIRVCSQRKSCFHVEPERHGAPILAALAAGSREAVQAFLRAQAETEPLASPLHGLCGRYQQERNKPKRSDLDFSRRTGVLYSLVQRREEAVALAFLLTSHDFDINSRNSFGRAPLSYAAAEGLPSVVRLMLEQGADVEVKDELGRTPLWWAADNGHEGVVKLLLAGGASLEPRDNNGQTPLSWAALTGREAVVKLLLAEGADPESKDKDGRTPLWWAAAVRGTKAVVVKLLLDKGAVYETKDGDGISPQTWAAHRHSILSQKRK